jgi:hypothetical protein
MKTNRVNLFHPIVRNGQQRYAGIICHPFPSSRIKLNPGDNPSKRPRVKRVALLSGRAGEKRSAQHDQFQREACVPLFKTAFLATYN